MNKEMVTEKRSNVQIGANGTKPVALLSVHNKDGIVEFAKGLRELGFDLVASRGTAGILREAGLSVYDTAEIIRGATENLLIKLGFDQKRIDELMKELGKPILKHRVVTLSREVHAGLLATDSEEDKVELKRLGAPRIDLVCVGLYPLEEAIADGKSREEIIEMTDIGGPTILRSAAKGRRIVICDPADRAKVLDWLKNDKPDEDTFITTLCAKAEFIVAKYCLASARYHSGGAYDGLLGERVKKLRYGENPQQKDAELFATDSPDPLAIHRFQTIAGKEAGFINETDTERLKQYLVCIAAAWEKNFGYVPKIAAVVKHGNTCAAAVGDDLIEVLKKTMEGNPRASHGGSVMTNFKIGKNEAEILRFHASEKKRMLDVVVAPEIDKEGQEILARIEGGCRMVVNAALLSLGVSALSKDPIIRPITGSFLKQPHYDGFIPDLFSQNMVQQGEITLEQKKAMVLADCIGARSNSNTITLTKFVEVASGEFVFMQISNAIGQQDRVGACELAVKISKSASHEIEKKDTCGSSDSFFPYPDGPKILVEAGVGAVSTCSGSKTGDSAVFPYFEKNGVSVIAIPNSDGRRFFGH